MTQLSTGRGNSTDPSQVAHHDRLYNQYKQIEGRKRQKEEEKMAQEMETCSFHP